MYFFTRSNTFTVQFYNNNNDARQVHLEQEIDLLGSIFCVKHAFLEK